MNTRCSSMNRRSFLGHAAGAGVAAALAPMIVPSRVLGRDGWLAPSERICMGFIGLGGQGSGHLFGGGWTYVDGGYLGRTSVQVLGVCDVWRDKREGAKQRVNEHYARQAGQGTYRSCEAYADYRELLQRPDIDAVLIATPIWQHGVQATLAAKCGKDVYCEKPTGGSIAEAKAIRDAMRRYGRVFQAGTQQRSEYGGKFRRAVQLVRGGRIGKLQQVYACCDGGMVLMGQRQTDGKENPDLFWDPMVGPCPWAPPHSSGWAAHDFSAGGINWGQHHYDIVQWGLDGDHTGPLEIKGKRLTFANGVEVIAGAPPDPTLGIPGQQSNLTQGGVVFVGSDGQIAVDRDFIISNPPQLVREPVRPDDAQVLTSLSHSGNFLDCVRTRQHPICHEETACRAATLTMLAYIGAQFPDRSLHWDPVAEHFTHDDDAKRMLTQAYRAPYILV